MELFDKNKMKACIHVIVFLAVGILAGCKAEKPEAENRIIISSSEGTACLDTARDILFEHGWSVSEGGSSKISDGKVSVSVTITGQTADGKKVYIAVCGTSAEGKHYLEVTTDDGFPVPAAEIVEQIKTKRAE